MFKTAALDNVLAPVFGRTKKPAVVKVANRPAKALAYWLSVGLIAANAVLLMSYIYGVNDFAAKGYEIKTLQTKLAALNEDNKKINLKVSEASSMVSIQSDYLSANYVSAGTPKFLQVPQLTQR